MAPLGQISEDRRRLMGLIDAEQNDTELLEAEDAAIRLAEQGGPKTPEGEFRLDLDDARTEERREDPR